MVDEAGEEVGYGCCSSEIRAGDVFAGYEELEMKLNNYKQERFVAFWKRDCRTIAAARKRGIERPLKPALKYYDIKFCCVHGGKTFNPRSRGFRSTS